MDLAKTLIRTVSRSFYEPDYILIIDAILLHSALRDDDLALLMGAQVKALRKLVAKLREDGMVSVHSRSETREGATRPFQKDYYYINMHRAIDVIKYRLKSMERKIEEKFGQTVEEKKEYFCPRCKNEYTQMEVLSSVGENGFVCQSCGADLQLNETNGTVANQPGHETQSRLNAQLKAFLDLMRQIDTAQVPENDFDTALANALPVQRDERTNPIIQSHAVSKAQPPATVHGLKQEAEKVQVSMADDSQAAQEREAAEKARQRARIAQQNQLPSWHTVSTVTGQRYANPKTEPDDAAVGTSAATVSDETHKDVKPKLEDLKDEEKKPDMGLDDIYANMEESEDEDDGGEKKDTALDAYYAAMEQDGANGSSDDSNSDDSDDDGSDDGNAMDEAPDKKRVRLENGTSGATPGGTSGDSDADD